MIYYVNTETKEHTLDYRAAKGMPWISVEADSNGWIPWHGGECPLPEGALYEAILANGEYRDKNSPVLWWGHRNGHPYRVVAYRPACYHRETAHHSDPLQRLREATTEIEGALQEVQDALPSWYQIVLVDEPGEPEPDMTDPENWREGDMLEWIGESGCYFTRGNKYTILSPSRPKKDDFDVIDDEGDRHSWDFGPAGDHFRFHSRP